MTIVMEKIMLKVSKSLLKAKMLEYFRKIEKTGEEIVVTSNRVPVIKISPILKRKTPDKVFKDLQGKVKYFEDILLDTSDEWREI